MIKYVFVDIDNTIAENTTCEDIPFYDGMYINKRPIKPIIIAILNMYSIDRIVVLSNVQGGSKGIIEKIDWLRTYANDMIAINDPIFIDVEETNTTKADFILSFSESFGIDPCECLIIDDKKANLQDCKKNGIQVKYPQQVLCDAIFSKEGR